MARLVSGYLKYASHLVRKQVYLVAPTSGLLVICNRDRCDLNYSFFGLELCPYQLELAYFCKKERAGSMQEQSLDPVGNSAISLP